MLGVNGAGSLIRSVRPVGLPNMDVVCSGALRCRALDSTRGHRALMKLDHLIELIYAEHDFSRSVATAVAGVSGLVAQQA